MNRIERLSNTVNELYIERSSDKKIEELSKSIESLKGQYDRAIVVLTAGLNKVDLPDGSESIKTEFVAHIREAAAAVKYKELREKGFNPVIITSGGKVYGHGENVPVLSEVMKAELIRKYGIDENDIIAEPFSVDTSQNARFSSKLLESLDFAESTDKSVFLITNQFHLDRATTLFKRHFNGNLEPSDAEHILTSFMKQVSDGTIKTPYKKVIESYLGSESNLKSTENDKKFHAITKAPFGEKLIEALAYYLRSTEQKMDIPVVNKKKDTR